MKKYLVDFRMALYGSENTCDPKIVRAFRTIGDTVSSIIRSTFTGSRIVKVVLNNAELIPNKNYNLCGGSIGRKIDELTLSGLSTVIKVSILLFYSL